MKITSFRPIATVIAGMLLCACGEGSAEEKAIELLQQARTQYEDGKYEQAVASIDSLRKTYPKAIEARKQALKLFQEVELKHAQEDLENVDKLLAKAKEEFGRMQQEVEKAKAAGKATAEQLTALTLKRIERDSLQARFDTQCAKIRYIHKKQQE